MVLVLFVTWLFLVCSHVSTVYLIRFSAEGTPFSVDSTGVVRMLNRSFGNTWVQVANMRKNVSRLSHGLSVLLDFVAHFM